MQRDTVQHNVHWLQYCEVLAEVYADASSIGISVGHIAEYWFERWWALFAEVNGSAVGSDCAEGECTTLKQFDGLDECTDGSAVGSEVNTWIQRLLAGDASGLVV